jgi:hypothetical protein
MLRRYHRYHILLCLVVCIGSFFRFFWLKNKTPMPLKKFNATFIGSLSTEDYTLV